MAAHGLGDSRSGTGGQTGSTDSSSSSRGDGSGGRSSGGGIGPGGSGASDPSGGRSGGSSSSSSSGGKSSSNSSSGKSSSSTSNSSGSKSAGNGSDGKASSSNSSARGSVGGDGPATGSTGKSTSSSTSRSSSGLGDRDGGGYGGTSVGRQSSSSSSRSSGSSAKSTLSASQESNLSSRLSGAVDAGTGRSLNETASGKTGRVGGGLATGGKTSLSSAQESNLASRLGDVSTATGRTGAEVSRSTSSAKSTLSAAQEANLAGRLGGTTAAAKTGRVGTGLAAGKTGLTPAQDVNLADRLGDVRTGKNLMAPSLEAKVADRLGSPTARTATGFATSARAAEDMSMGALREEQAKSAKNYGLGFASQARAAEDQSMARKGAWDKTLGMIRSAEANQHGYKSVGYTSSYGKPSRDDLTDMTIGEVMGWQEEQDGSRGKGYKADRTYVGAYQIGKSTLGEAVARTGLSLDTKFTKATQDYLAQDLVQNRANRATRNGTIEDDRFADQIAMEWAGVAASTGRSYYDGVAGNKSSVPYSETLGAAKALTSTGAVGANRGGAPGKTSRTGADLPEAGPTPTARSSVPGRGGLAAPTSRETALASVAPATAALTSTRAVSDEVRAAAERRGVDPVAVAEYAERYGMDAETAAFALTPQDRVAGYRDPEARTIAAAPSVYSPPSQGDIAEETAPALAAANSAPAPARERFATKYLGATPTNVPTPTSRPNVLANEAPATAAPKAERSLPDKVLSGAIDAGVGLLPGVGLAAGVYGLAAPMLGLPTIGDAALAVRDTNEFDLKESLKNPSREGDGNDGSPRPAPEGSTQREAAGAPSTTVAGFESKYLAWRDPTPRPTPEERWGAAGSNGGMPYGA